MLILPPIQTNGKTMPRKYPDQTKQAYAKCTTIFLSPAAPPLSACAPRVNGATNCQRSKMVRMSEKTFQPDIKRTQNQLVAENSAETCQHAAACKWGFIPPQAPLYTYCIYTLCQNTGILSDPKYGTLWAPPLHASGRGPGGYGHLRGHSLRDRRRSVAAVSGEG